MAPNNYNYNKTYNLYLTKEEERYINIICPLQFALNNISHKDRQPSLPMLINCLQNMFREIFYIFVNYPFNSKLPLFFSLVVNKYYYKKFMEMLPLIKFCFNKYGLFRTTFTELVKLEKGNKETDPLFYATLFSIFYSEFAAVKKESTQEIIYKPSCNNFDIEDLLKQETDHNYLKPLQKLHLYVRERLSEYLSGFYLHGSFATKDYVKNWSDIDTLMIVKKDTLENPKKLLKFQKLVYNGTGFLNLMDPFQSHGFFIITECDLEYYPQTYFPIELFKYSESFLDNDPVLQFNIRNYKTETMELFWRDFVHYLRHMVVNKIEKKKELKNEDTRMLLHRIYAFPTFYLQTKGVHCYKKYSFGLAEKDFSKKEWDTIRIANKVWENWIVHYGYKSLPSTLFTYSPFVSNVILKRYYTNKKNIFNKYSIDYKSLLLNTSKLLDKTWANLLRDQQ